MVDPFEPKTVEPATLMIGRYAAWKITSDVDAALFSLKYVFTKDDVSRSVVGTYADGYWTFTMASALTELIAHGRNTVDLIAVRNSDAEEVICRTFYVNCFSTDVDRRSHAQLMVDKIESILSGRADNDVESYSIKSRSITKMSIEELTKWREYYLAELGREPDPLTGKASKKNTVKVGFV